MDLQTSYELSYLENRPKPRQVPPWALKSKHEKSTIPFGDKTVQKESYKPPGVFIEIDAEHECPSGYSPQEVIREISKCTQIV